MNVIFDYQIFYLQRYGGISRYFYELAKALSELNNCDPRIVAPLNSNEYLTNAKGKDFILSLNPVLQKLSYNRLYDIRLNVNKYLGKQMASKENTILHETYYTHRFSTKSPKVITIHDMIYELFNNNTAEEMDVIRYKKQSILEADCIIAVSENTRKDLLNFYPEVKDKTFVVYHGVDQSSHSEIPAFNFPKPFMLHVGNRGWYKNFERLLEVYGSDPNLYTSWDLICYGGGKISLQEAELLKKYNLQSKVHFMSGNDTKLISLYKSAIALVYISNYEGFGMPLLEAMALSCPTISSNTSSLPEVYGESALVVDPTNNHELSLCLNAITFKSDLRTQLIESGKKRASAFTWKKCAFETYNVYKKIV